MTKGRRRANVIRLKTSASIDGRGVAPNNTRPTAWLIRDPEWAYLEMVSGLHSGRCRPTQSLCVQLRSLRPVLLGLAFVVLGQLCARAVHSPSTVCPSSVLRALRPPSANIEHRDFLRPRTDRTNMSSWAVPDGIDIAGGGAQGDPSQDTRATIGKRRDCQQHARGCWA